jgi:hypothetical protein
MKMPFGKHKGKPLKDVPDDYLLWVFDNCKRISPTLLRAITTRLEIEFPEPSAKGNGKQEPNGQANNAEVTRAKAELKRTRANCKRPKES